MTTLERKRNLKKLEVKKFCECCKGVKIDNGFNNIVYGDWICDECIKEIKL